MSITYWKHPSLARLAPHTMSCSWIIICDRLDRILSLSSLTYPLQRHCEGASQKRLYIVYVLFHLVSFDQCDCYYRLIGIVSFIWNDLCKIIYLNHVGVDTNDVIVKRVLKHPLISVSPCMGVQGRSPQRQNTLTLSGSLCGEILVLRTSAGFMHYFRNNMYLLVL